MTAKEIIENGLKETFRDSKDNMYQLQAKPGLNQAQIEEFEKRLAVQLPSEVRELLGFTSGFSFPQFGDVNFFAKEVFGLEELIPLGVTTSTDGCGNDWVVDINKDTGAWGPVIFVSHDPPVVVIQARDLAGFLEQILDLGRPESKSQLDSARRKATISRLWRDDPYLVGLGVRGSLPIQP
jgi:cell wall assembly regulator SMI1